MTLERLRDQCTHALEHDGLFGALKTLNATTNYRFTGIYRFDGRWVKSVWLYDREHPNVQFGSDVLWDDSYCRMTAASGDSCEIVNSLTDGRLSTHAARRAVQCYVAVLLRNRDGSAFGTLCHYDVSPHATAPETFDVLRKAREVLEPALATQLTPDV